MHDSCRVQLRVLRRGKFAVESGFGVEANLVVDRATLGKMVTARMN